jgi:hypothetical protein
MSYRNFKKYKLTSNKLTESSMDKVATVDFNEIGGEITVSGYDKLSITYSLIENEKGEDDLRIEIGVDIDVYEIILTKDKAIEMLSYLRKLIGESEDEDEDEDKNEDEDEYQDEKSETRLETLYD